MRRVIQGDLGPATLVSAGEAAAGDNPRLFLDEFEAEGYLRGQFLADPADMAVLRDLLDDAEQTSLDNLSDDEVITRLATHLVMGGITLIEGSVPGGAAGGGGAGAGEDAAKEAEEAAKAAAPVKAEDETLIDIVIQLMYWNPITRKPRAFPKGVKVNLVNGSTVMESRTTDEKGVCVYSERKYTSQKPHFHVEFLFTDYIDLDKNEMVAAGSVQPGDQRRLLRMPPTWTSTKAKKFVDNRGGRFSTGKLTSLSKGQQGTKGSPWKIQIDKDWEQLWASFTLYNHLSKKTDAICYGGLLEVFNDPGMGGGTRVAAGTVLDRSKGLCYIGIWSKTARDKLHMRLRCGDNAYLDLKKKAAARTILTVGEAALAGYSGVKRRRHYPLPAEWRSKNQYAFIGKKHGKYEDQIKKGISRGKPISFHLDDFVLVDAGGTPVAWNANNRFTLFNNLMGIRAGDTNEPYLTKHKRSHNHFAAFKYYYVKGKGSTQISRVVGFNREFYDLLHKRTTRGNIIGVRAAVLDDHPKGDQIRPLVPICGNYTVHYFHDCAILSGKPLAHLLVYWSVHFRTDPAAGVATGTVTPGVLAAYKKATQQVKIRHEGLHPSAPGRSRSKHKEYRLRPTSGPMRTIKICVHIEARPAAPVHTIINVHDDGGRDSISVPEAWFSTSNTAANNGNVTRDLADRIKYAWFTFAHETGHALGLYDEYLEPIKNPANNKSIWTTPALPCYAQYYPGMPYTVEANISMMESNKALRLRHYWQYCRWINETAAVQTLLGNKRYRIEYPIRSGPTLRFYLKTRYKDFYKPYKDKKSPPLTRGTKGKMELYLYKTGQDEMQRFNIKAGFQGVDSILVVQIKVHFAWPNNHAGASYNTWALQTAVMKSFGTQLGRFSGMNNAPVYTLECPTGDFRKCLIYFRPMYDVTVAGPPAAAHFKLQVRPNHASAAHNTQDVYTEGFNSDTIKVTNKVKWQTVLRYMLGLAPINVTGAGATKKITPITTISEADLNFLATWIKGALGAGAGDFQVKKY